METPKDPQVKGVPGGVEHDGMDDAGHEKQANKGGHGESVNREDEHED